LAESDISAYAHTLLDDVRAHAETSGCDLRTAFTELVLEQFCADGHAEDATPAYYREHGIEVSGWGASGDNRTLDLFLILYSPRADDDYRINRSDVAAAFKRLQNFLTRCATGPTISRNRSSEVTGMCAAVHDGFGVAEKVRLVLVTNARSVMRDALPAASLRGRRVVHELWDLQRLANWAASGSKSEPIIADFPDGLRCLATPRTNEDYAVFLAIVPGAELASLYSTHGARLLELNVRSFLQVRGGVNKGILETLRDSPERFLAYNNGIAATASLVDFDDLADGHRVIRRIHNLQVVNGGQTTATIHHAHRSNVPLHNVHVQMKLTVVSPDKLDDIVPQISAFSNTQNRVTASDLKANSAFHVEIERIVRNLWAPPSPTASHDTHWFYERARGQYANALARETTDARRKIFRQINPPGQKFTKSELAKYLQSWEARPHLVSLGAEKNFVLFSEGLDASPITVDKVFCRHLIAKAILFRQTDKIVAKHQFGGYKANIVTYTIAKLVTATAGRVDLERIWRDQTLSPALAAAVAELSVLAQKIITSPPGGRTHVGEWAKRAECWNELLAVDWAVPESLAAELVEVDTYATDLELVRSLTARQWADLAGWGAATGRLDRVGQETANEISRVLSRGWDPAGKHVQAGAELLRRATTQGFRSEPAGAAGLGE
jgi:hypothetical protein